MQLSPATLSTITAILSAQGVSVDHSRLQAALAPLTGETPSTPTVLQPGERVWVLEGYDSDCDSVRVSENNTLEAAAECIADRIHDTNADRWTDTVTADDFHVLIVRKAIVPTSRTAVTFEE